MNHLHKLFICVVLGCVLAPMAKAQKVTLDNYQRLQVEFATGQLRVAEVSLNGQSYNTVSIDGYMASAEVGQPCLPTWSSLIEVPLCDGYEVVVSDAEYDTLDASTLGLRHQLLPLQPSRSKSDTLRHATVTGSAYATDAYYGVALALVEPVGVARDRNLARLQFSPISYNPVSGRLVVCRRATVEVRYLGADREATLEHFNRYHSPLFGGTPVLNDLYPKAVRTAAPVRYLIVAHSMFRGQLNEFVQWKRRKGFLVDIVYTDSAAVGTTTTSIQSFIRSQYTGATAANPAPTYLLLVGDHEQIPAFTGTTDNDHITDLYYTTWTTGDNIPDCYHGRFSAQNVAQLTPQVQKTLMYEQYTFSDPSFLDRAVMVAGVDGGNTGDNGYTYGDPALDYAITNYINGAHGFSEVRYFKNNTSIVPAGVTNVYTASSASSMSATVRSYYNQGAGLINYTAHGSATSWGTPNFTTTHAAAMTNRQKFGLMIGNCCLTNKFQTSTCLGEAVLRKDDYCGAVGYIGGSNSTYWGEDFYWAVGVRSNIGPTMSMAYNASSMGVYDRVMHTHGEAYSQWAITQGAMMFQGNMAVESSSSSLKLYYWEIYHLMGDPSVMPYLTQASEITVNAAPIIIAGSGSFTVNTVPYAYVALTNATTHALVAASYATAGGLATLTLPATLTPGNYELAISAQQYRTAFRDISVVQPTNTFAYVNAMTATAALKTGSTVPLAITLSNPGDSTTRNIVLHLSSSDAALTFTANDLLIDSLNADASLLINDIVYANVALTAADGATASVTATVSWSGCQQPITTIFPFTLQAPVLTLSITGNTSLPPATNGTLNITLSNSGHADIPSSHLELLSPTMMLSIAQGDTAALSLTEGSTVTRNFTLQADSQMPQNIIIPLQLKLAEASIFLDTTVHLFIGTPVIETFDGGSFHLSGWSQGSYPWTFDTGNGTLRSTSALSHSQTAEISISRTYTAADSITFLYNVSSEENYDKFHFYIDGNDMLTQSGETGWTRAAFAVGVGSHTFKFAYAKDYSVNNGSDCAWIDDVAFQTPVQPVVLRRDTVCTDNLYILFGDTIDTHTPGSGVAQGTENNMTTIVDYNILSSIVITDSVATCDSYFWRGQEYTDGGIYTQSVSTPGNCDSVLTLVLTLHYSVADTVADTTTGGVYLWNGTEYTASGEYQQVLTTVDGCDSTVTLLLTVLGSEGLSDISTYQRITIHPNPTTGNVQLSEQADEVRVYDLQGREVIRLKDVQQFDLGQLPQGVYTLRIGTPQGTATLRLIRQ